MCSYYGYISEVECLNFEKSYKVRHQLIVPLYILTPSVCEVHSNRVFISSVFLNLTFLEIFIVLSLSF